MDNMEIVKEIGTLQEKTKGHSKRLDNLEDSNKELSKLSTLMEVQIDMNQKQQQQMERQHETLIKVNENLTGMNTGLSEVKERVGKLEETDKSKKIDLVFLIKEIIFKGVPAIVVAYALFKWGL